MLLDMEIGYGNHFVKIINDYIKNDMKKIILIGGGSCSGKTTLANLICNILGNSDSIIISQDNYFIDYSQCSEKELENENFDQPSAFMLSKLVENVDALLQNKKVLLPLYDFQLHKAHEYREVYPMNQYKYIIIEGIMGFQNQYLNDISDLRIFVYTDMDIMLARRIQRDKRERFFHIESTLDRYLKYVRNGYLNYVLPSLKNADVKINGNVPFVKKDIINILNQYGIIELIPT